MIKMFSKKRIINVFALYLAKKQKKADYFYYIEQDEEMSDFTLSSLSSVRDIINILGIGEEVYSEAYKIYDFRNSGKKDFVPDLEELKKNGWKG